MPRSTAQAREVEGHQPTARAVWDKHFPNVVAATLALALTAFATRAYFNWHPLDLGIAHVVGRALIHSYYDFLAIFGIAALFSFLLLATCRWWKLAAVVMWTFYGVTLIELVLLIVNIRATRLLKGPLTYQWLYYSDFLRSFTAQNSVISAAKPLFLIFLALVPVGFFVWIRLAAPVLRRWQASRGFIGVVLLAGLAAAVYVPLAATRVSHVTKNGVVANPLVELLRTAAANGTRTLSTLPTRFASSDFKITKIPPAAANPSAPVADPRIRNVILIVMESVGARYVYSKIGNDYATPEINAARSMSMAFPNFYAHVPYSNKALFSMLTGRYPKISFRSETEAYANAKIPSIGTELKAQNFRTAFFMSGDFRFQSADKFLDNRGFDKRSDMENIVCNRRFSTSDDEYHFSDSVEDHCTGTALSDWIDEAPQQRFFAVFWTGNTHWPYSFTGLEKDFVLSSATAVANPLLLPGSGKGGDEVRYLNRYANALRSSDEAIGQLLKHLAQRDLLKSTLVVIIGDHGEAFGQHGSLVHGESVYEEEIQIPLIMINPLLFSGQKNDAIGGEVDIAPTIMNILGFNGASWQGRSLFDPDRGHRIYFFCANRDMLVGFREGTKKYIFNATRDTIATYDLIHDPQERSDLGAGSADMAAVVKERLASWVQYQDRQFDLMAKTDNP